jgi:dUTPase
MPKQATSGAAGFDLYMPAAGARELQFVLTVAKKELKLVTAPHETVRGMGVYGSTGT